MKDGSHGRDGCVLGFAGCGLLSNQSEIEGVLSLVVLDATEVEIWESKERMH